MYPDSGRADLKHLRYLGDLISGKAMQGDNVALAALHLGDSPANLTVVVSRVQSIATTPAGRHAYRPDSTIVKARLLGPVRGTPDLEDLSCEGRRQPCFALLVSQPADSRPVFQRFQVSPLVGIVGVGVVAAAHPVSLAEKGFRGVPVERPEPGLLVGAQQGFLTRIS